MSFEESGIDIVALKEKYRQERDKRWRADGARQYLEVTGGYGHFYDQDPNVHNSSTRKKVSEAIDVAIIGGGFAGLMAGVHMRHAGIRNFRIIELGHDLGGTWYWNRYPGVQCDIESYCYIPLLEEMEYIPKEKYSYGQEIFEHCQRIGERFELYDVTHFGMQVNALRWYGSLKRWLIGTKQGDDITARFVVMATGPFNRPKLPSIPGIDKFRGHSFHTCRWDYDYTGGDTNGGQVKLRDKRVAIIGTGATAIQCIPHLGRHAKHLYVFQRTPSSVSVRGNRPTDPEWAKSLRPGWQRARRDNLNAVLLGLPAEEDLVHDGWTEINRRLLTLPRDTLTPEKLGELMEIEDFKRMNGIRARVGEIVRHPDIAEALRPWYKFWCKRPTFSDDYLPTFNRENVTLVDVGATKGVDHLTERGVVANGSEYAVDCVIFASGYEVTSDPKRRFGIPIFEGREGLSLYEHWKTGLKTLHGFTTSRFPNLFFTGYTQVAISANFTSMLDDQTKHISYIISEVMRRDAATVEATEEAQEAWVATIRRLAPTVGDFWKECTPSFYNNEGGPMPRSNGMGDDYAPGINAFNALLKRWCEQGELQGLALAD